jgi:hypothetical protein
LKTFVLHVTQSSLWSLVLHAPLSAMAPFKPSQLRKELSSYLKDAESWKPEGVLVEAF